VTVRFTVDPSWRRFGRVVLAGSPLRLFRLTAAGASVAERVESGDDLPVQVTSSTLFDRLLDAGAVHPRRPGDRGATHHGVDDVTVVTPQLGGIAHDDGRLTVDDGSPIPIAGATVRLEPNRGPAAARDAARPLIGTPLVAFIDADVSPEHPAWFADLLWHFDDPRVGLVAPRVRGETGSPLDLGDRPARIRAGTRVSYVPAAALLVRTDAFDDVGGFDERLRFGEDVDLVWRLDEAGWRCRYDPTVSVFHEPRRSWRARLRQHADYGTSAAPLALRHPGALSPLHVNGWTAAAWVSVVVGIWPIGAVLALGSSLALVRKLPDVPARSAVSIALRGHLLAGQQVAAAARREWWPIVLAGALVSRRWRWWAVIAVLVAGRRTPTDVAYGWGVWSSMRRLRTWAPIVPRLSAWPGRQPRQA
jgi:mycofactocin system glycosyltransferase